VDPTQPVEILGNVSTPFYSQIFVTEPAKGHAKETINLFPRLTNSRERLTNSGERVKSWERVTTNVNFF